LISNPIFLADGRIAYLQENQLRIFNPKNGSIRQPINFHSGAPKSSKKPNTQDSLISASELSLFNTLRRKKEKSDFLKSEQKALKTDTIPVFYLNDRSFSHLPKISTDGKFLAFQLSTEAKSTTTKVPSYVNETGLTFEIPSRENVGAVQSSQEFYIVSLFNNQSDTLKSSDLPGISQQPDFYKDYPKLKNKKPAPRPFFVEDFLWNPEGNRLLVDVRSQDNKDRWLMVWEAQSRQWKTASHQRDEAWIGGPASDGNSFGWVNADKIWFLSEESGFSHLYLFNQESGEKTSLTSGKFEVSSVQFSSSQSAFFYISNEENPGIHSIYKLSLKPKSKPEKISAFSGGHEFTLSPDEKQIAYRFSTATKPWELYIQEARAGANPVQITRSAASPEFQKLNFAEPEYVLIPAADGSKVPARLYKPKTGNENGAGVIFVHGAGYLQNAHRHWSNYFREFMFHQMLMEEGFTVLDIDYRGSAGYGRDWRTGIYRHMGGKDLDDQIDAAGWMTSNLNVDAKRIGIYGGSYGGFITLMALCTKPGVFRCGAALRSVTDWMHYNHGYTSNILNTPEEDSLSYRRSSPINFAQGLQGRLLMCHGMVDVNVHYQDIVRFSQRLIELGKQNWELASYPLEDHGFTEPESWLDEYRRIHRIFREELLLKK
jgi:dipeptidyl aminopeptidase/acylaminoacyl peptidase